MLHAAPSGAENWVGTKAINILLLRSKESGPKNAEQRIGPSKNGFIGY